MANQVNERAARSPFLQSLIAGAVAGTTVDLSLFPIDTLKTRLQSSAGFTASGGFRGVYAGIGSVVIGSAPNAALFFVIYEATKSALQPSSSSSTITSAMHPSVSHMLAASAGEIAACAVRVPTEVVKQRAQAASHGSSRAALAGIVAAAQGRPVSLARELYRGWGITVMREVPFTVIQFPLWEAMRAARCRAAGRKEATGVESAVCGALAGTVAAAATTPLDVLKTRTMLATGKRVRLGVLARDVWTREGPKAFFAGLGPRVMWISIGGAVFLGSYQWAKNALREVL